MTNTGSRNVKRLSLPGFNGVILFLCLVHVLTGTAVASKSTTENDVHIETTAKQLLGEENAARFKTMLKPDETISWEVYLPNNDAKEAPGVFVYVSPMKTGRIDSRWREVMDQQNLIYIGANNSGNRVLSSRRIVLAMFAVRALGQHYAFDTSRINVSGFSGGGRVASRIATQYPEVFTGALYICGVDFWKKDKTPNVERLLQNRFVFLTGTSDFNRRETRQIQERYIKAGAQHTKLIIVPGMAHKHPDATYLTEALQFLLDKG